MGIVIAMILKSESISNKRAQYKRKKEKKVGILRGRDKIYLSSSTRWICYEDEMLYFVDILFEEKLLVGNIMNLISAHWQFSYAVYLSFFCSKLGKIKWLGNFVKRSPHKRVAASGVVSFGQSFGFLRESRDTSDLLLTSFSRVSGLFHWWQNMRLLKGSN